MPPVSLSRIPFILDAHLAAGLSEAPGLPEPPVGQPDQPTGLPPFSIAFEGEDFTPPGSIWLRPVCQPGQMQGEEKGAEGWSRRVGLYLVDVIAPGGLPPADAWAVAGRVEELFRRASIEDVQIEDPYTTNLGLNAQNAFQLRVIIPWWCWANN